ncbi:MAG: hypothetical protein LBF16_04350 [Pseudomonadales bacterium]|jgi:hypothetical protein|nr:hypothetical protein [Pseudomonadales bacterium]
MKFHSDGLTYKAVSITGPTHNFLGVEFAPSDVITKSILVEPVQLNPMEPAKLVADEVKHWTEKGVREANEEMGTDYRLSRITFVVSDSPPVEVYREMAKRIALRLHARPLAFNGIEEPA